MTSPAAGHDLSQRFVAKHFSASWDEASTKAAPHETQEPAHGFEAMASCSGLTACAAAQARSSPLAHPLLPQ